ncbi:MAG: hypothetical protein MI784_16440 [Cytophagales bacterium]|nr:hypothetical protein [Cytophagales bacterium]
MKKYLYLLFGLMMTGCLDSDTVEPYWESYAEFNFDNESSDEVWGTEFAGYDLPKDTLMEFISDYSDKPDTRLKMEVLNNSSDSLVGMAKVKLEKLKPNQSYEAVMNFVHMQASITEEEYNEADLRSFLGVKKNDKYVNGIFLKFGVFNQEPVIVETESRVSTSLKTGEIYKATDDLVLLGRLPVNNELKDGSRQVVTFKANAQGEAWVTLVWMSNIKDLDHSVSFDYLRVLFHELETEASRQ